MNSGTSIDATPLMETGDLFSRNAPWENNDRRVANSHKLFDAESYTEV